MHLKRFSLIIEILRKYNRLTVAELLKENSCKICDRKTYTKIVSASPIRDHAIYSELLERFHLKAYNVAIPLNFTNLWNAIEYCDINLIEKESTFILKSLEKYKDDYYYSFIFHIIEKTQQFYMNNIRTDRHELLLYHQLIPLFDEHLRNIVFILELSSSNLFKKSELDLLYEEVMKVDNYVFNIYYLNYHINCETPFEGSKYIAKIENQIPKNNIIRVLDFYDNASIILSDLKAKDNPYKQKFIDFLEENESQLPDNKKIQYYGNVAKECLLSNQVEKALYYFLKIEHIPSRRKKAIYNFIIYCKSALGQVVDEKYYKLGANEYYTEADNAVYSYYLEKQKRTPLQNKRYINSIVEHEISDERVYLKIMEEEIYLLSSKTKRFTHYANMKHNLKFEISSTQNND